MDSSRLPLLLSAALASGCGLYGPESIRATRTDYNIAIQQTDEQQLLLNLVRLKYRDSLNFLAIDNVASSLEYNRSFAAAATAPTEGVSTFNLGAARIELFERPTAIYRPLVGKAFVRRLLSPLNLEALILFSNSGWPLDRLLLVTVQEMNGLKNAPTASGPTPEFEPEYRGFRRAVELLRSLQRRNRVEWVQRVSDKESILELRFIGEATDADAREARRLLGLESGRDSFPLLAAVGALRRDAVVVTPRTLIGAMNYLAQGVVVPSRDFKRGWVTHTLNRAETPFDWRDVLKDIITVHSSDDSPTDPAVAIRYRDSWFFIRDGDLASKETFSLLTQLFALQAGEIEKIGPAINLLIGR